MPLQSLPVMRSMHMTIRFLYPFSFLLTAVAVWSVAKMMERRRLEPHAATIALCGGCITVLAFVVAYAENLERFVTGQKTTWKMSALQHAANRISVLSLIAIAVFGCAMGWRRWRRTKHPAPMPAPGMEVCGGGGG